MVVELYTEQETATGNTEEMELHLELAKELGLTSQEELHSDKGVDGYRKMTAEEQFVFSINFPETVALGACKSLIPIRILTAIKEFKKIHPDLGIFLLCPEPGKPDPIVVGSQYHWNASTDGLLIGRFGEALEEFSVLRANAIEALKKRLKNVENWNFTVMRSVYAQAGG